MAQHGVVSARQHGCQQPALASELGVPEGVHAALEARQAPGDETVVDRILTEPQGQQLPPRHHTMLLRRKLMDRIQPAHIAG
jgi:hypothetical protein